MKFQEGVKTRGEKIMSEMMEYLKDCEKAEKGWSKLKEVDKMRKRNAWSVEFLRTKGIIVKSAKGKQEEQK